MIPTIADSEIEVIIAEDSQTQAEQLKFLLENNNYFVTVARDGKDALELIKQRKPSIVISDVAMPEMSGYELCKRIKANPELKDIPVILLTALADPMDVLNGLESGADNFITKPFESNQLLSRITYLLINRQLRKENHSQLGLEIYYGGEKRLITADRVQILDLFISTFEAAVQQNAVLKVAQDETRKAAELLEQKVSERTEHLDREIKTRAQIESALTESERRYRDLIESTNDIVQSVAPDGHFEFVNPAWKRILGYKVEEIPTLKLNQIIHPNHIIHCREIFERVQKGESFSNVEVVLVAKDGSLIEVEGNITGRYVDGECLATHAFFRDVTRRNAAEKERVILFEAETKARKTTEILRAANIALTKSLKIDDVLNILLEYVQQLVPFDSANVMLREGEHFLRVVSIRGYGKLIDSDKTRELRFDLRTNSVLRKILTERSSLLISNVEHEPDWETVEGAEHVKSWLGVPLLVAGEVVGIYSLDNVVPESFTEEHLYLAEAIASQAAIAIKNAELFEQVTDSSAILENRVLERTAELTEALERAESADRSKSAFLAMMSHELRTPLNSIIGFSGVLIQEMTGELNPEQKKQMGMVQNSARHLLSLINDVLDISKIEAGEMVILIQPIDLPLIIKKVIASCTPLAEKKSIAINLNIDKEIGSLLCDAKRLEQILLNLLTNAIKFTNAGEISVVCFANTDQVIIQVKDTGIGIRPEDLSRLFMPFQQIENIVSRLNGGIGLGLAISKKLAEKLGGGLTVESEFGVGSAFSLTLLIKPVENNETKNSDN